MTSLSAAVRGRAFFHPLAVGIAALLPYLSTLGNGFALDDFGLIRLNEAVKTFDLRFLLTSDYWSGFEGWRSGLYRPLTTLSFALEYWLWGDRPAWFHLTNLLLHAGNALAVYSLCRRLAGGPTGLLAGLLFAVHPAYSEAVAGIAGRADLLAALWVLIGLHGGLKARLERGWWQLCSPLALGVGLFCKEGAAVLPGLLLGIDWLWRREGRLRGWLWKEYGLQALAVAGYLAARRAALGGLGLPAVDFLDNPLAGMAAPLRLVNAAGVVLRYLSLLVFPGRLCADYSYDAIPLAGAVLSPALVGAIGLLAGLGWLAWRFRRRPSRWSLGAVWVLVGLAPVANVFLPIGTIMAERLLYLPAVGFALLAAEVLRRIRREQLRVAASAALVLLLAGRAAARSRDWQDNEHLFRTAAAVCPRSAKVQEGLGAALRDRGDLAGALAAFQRAIEIYPQYQAAHYDLGLVHWQLRQYDRALPRFQEAVRLKPRDFKAWLNLGATYRVLERTAQAELAYRQALELRADYAPAWQNLADLYWETGQREKAVSAGRELLRLQPDPPRREEWEARIRSAGR
jgi:protein O-mannosyl-transferase